MKNKKKRSFSQIAEEYAFGAAALKMRSGAIKRKVKPLGDSVRL